jgi:CheY-like chemotaxis protein
VKVGSMLGDHRVLVIGGGACAVDDLVSLLDAFGYDTDCIDDTALVLDKLRDAQYCCLVAEIQLSNPSAIDVLVQVRRAGVWVPAVLVAPYLSERERERVDALGVEVVLSGPPPVNWVWKLGDALQRSTRHASGFIRKVSADEADEADVNEAVRRK